jgi:hypothetical protein
MTPPLRLPVRILVKGASTTVYTSWMSGPRSDFAWPRVIEEALVAADWPNEVRCSAVPAVLTKASFKTWPEEVLAWSPDILVLDYGRMETVHLFLPRWLERYANSLAVRPHPIRKAYRARVTKPLWKYLVAAQRMVDGAMPTSTSLSQWRIRRGLRDIAGIIARMRTVASPLMLIPEIPPFGKPYQKHFPGANPRVDLVNQWLRDLVRELDDPNIVFVPMAHLWEQILATGEDPGPDVGHFTPEMHRGFGEELGRVALEWTEKQPHLLVDRTPDR